MTYWPASSSTTPRYAGPVSFFRLPTLSNPADADIAFIEKEKREGTEGRKGRKAGQNAGKAKIQEFAPKLRHQRHQRHLNSK